MAPKAVTLSLVISLCPQERHPSGSLRPPDSLPIHTHITSLLPVRVFFDCFLNVIQEEKLSWGPGGFSAISK